MKALKRSPKPLEWITIKVRGATYTKIREAAGAIAWHGWSNLPEPWRGLWSKLARPMPGVDSVIDVAVSAMHEAVMKLNRPHGRR